MVGYAGRRVDRYFNGLLGVGVAGKTVHVGRNQQARCHCWNWPALPSSSGIASGMVWDSAWLEV
jgi:hypothetical protein